MPGKSQPSRMLRSVLMWATMRWRTIRCLSTIFSAYSMPVVLCRTCPRLCASVSIIVMSSAAWQALPFPQTAHVREAQPALPKHRECIGRTCMTSEKLPSPMRRTMSKSASVSDTLQACARNLSHKMGEPYMRSVESRRKSSCAVQGAAQTWERGS